MGGYEVGVWEFWNSGKRRKALVFLFLDISISSRSLDGVVRYKSKFDTVLCVCLSLWQVG